MDDQYIKMVLALPDEIFKDVRPKFGDIYWVETYQGWNEGYSRKTYAVCDTVFRNGDYSLILQDQTQVDFRLYAVNFKYNRRDDVIYWKKWLVPSQEHLRQIMDMSPIEFIEDLYEYAHEPIREGMDASIFYIDLNCFTLAYVMDRKCKKYWDGESWV